MTAVLIEDSDAMHDNDITENAIVIEGRNIFI